MSFASSPVTAINTNRLQSLAAYLILHADAPQPRERLAFLLWPASSEPQARTNLRQLLHHLKRAFDQRQRFTVSFVYDLGFLAQAMKTWPKRVTWRLPVERHLHTRRRLSGNAFLERRRPSGSGESGNERSNVVGDANNGPKRRDAWFNARQCQPDVRVAGGRGSVRASCGCGNCRTRAISPHRLRHGSRRMIRSASGSKAEAR